MPNAPRITAPTKNWDKLSDSQKVNEMVKAGELKRLYDGFGQFGGYEDEAGHIHSSIEELKDEGVI